MKRFILASVLALGLAAASTGEANAHGGGGFSFGFGIRINWQFGAGDSCGLPCYYPPPMVYGGLGYASFPSPYCDFGGMGGFYGHHMGYAGYGY